MLRSVRWKHSRLPAPKKARLLSFKRHIWADSRSVNDSIRIYTCMRIHYADILEYNYTSDAYVQMSTEDVVRCLFV